MNDIEIGQTLNTNEYLCVRWCFFCLSFDFVSISLDRSTNFILIVLFAFRIRISIAFVYWACNSFFIEYLNLLPLQCGTSVFHSSIPPFQLYCMRCTTWTVSAVWYFQRQWEKKQTNKQIHTFTTLRLLWCRKLKSIRVNKEQSARKPQIQLFMRVIVNNEHTVRKTSILL